jgi:hypothetical protein
LVSLACGLVIAWGPITLSIVTTEALLPTRWGLAMVLGSLLLVFIAVRSPWNLVSAWVPISPWKVFGLLRIERFWFLVFLMHGVRMLVTSPSRCLLRCRTL